MNADLPEPTVDAAPTSAGVKSADRLMLLLEYLALHGQVTFRAITQDLDLPNSSGHQLLHTAINRGFVELDEEARTYSLGMKLLEIGQAYYRKMGLSTIAQPHMDRLRELLGETVQLAKLDELSAVHIAVSKSPHPVKLITDIGMRSPAHATGLGKVLLSGLSDDELRSRLSGVVLKSYTDHTVTNHRELLAEIRKVREQGYADDREEYAIGCRCFAMPLHNDSGRVVAALSISIPTPRLTEDVARTALVRLGETARSVEARLTSG